MTTSPDVEQHVVPGHPPAPQGQPASFRAATQHLDEPTAPDAPWYASGWALAAAALVQAAVVVPWRWFPTEDGPTNVASARVLLEHRGAFAEWFRLDLFPKFDLGWQLLLAALGKVLPLLVAERVLIVGLIVGLPLATAYAMSTPRSGRVTPAAWVSLPLAIGWFVHAGYHSFCLGLVLGLTAVGWGRRHRGVKGIAGLAALLTLTYIAHVVPLAAAGLWLGLVKAWPLTERRFAASPIPADSPPPRTITVGPASSRGYSMAALRDVVGLAIAAAPAAALFVAYLTTRDAGSGVARLSPLHLVFDLVTMTGSVVSYGRSEAVVTTALFAVLAVSGVAALRVAPRRLAHPSQAWLVALLVFGALYLVVPDRVGAGAHISGRFALFIVLGAVGWLSSIDLPKWSAQALAAAGLVGGLALSALHVGPYGSYNRDLAEFDSVAPHLRAGQTVVPLFYVQDDSPRPVMQATGYLMAERRVVDLSHFQGQYDYFATQFRPGKDPFEALNDGESWINVSPPEITLDRSVDAVLVWGLDEASADVRRDPATKAVQVQLRRDYRLDFTSPGGRLQLWVRNARR